MEKGASPPAARSAAAAEPLPRQINTNSNGNVNPNANQLTPYWAKKRFAVQKDVEGFVRQWGGEDYCAELTLTFAENITEKAEASRRFNQPVRNQPSARVHLQGLRDIICGTAENEHKDGLLVKRGFGYIHHLASIKNTAARLPDISQAI